MYKHTIEVFPVEKIIAYNSQMCARSLDQRNMLTIYGANNIRQTNDISQCADSFNKSKLPKCMDVPFKQSRII
jgi:hypothetical protein